MRRMRMRFRLVLYQTDSFWPNFCCRKHRAINEELMTRCADAYFEKTGYKHPMHNPDVVKKLSDTVFEHTGYKYSFQNPEVKDKIKSTIKRKYNCDNIMHNKESLDKVFISTRRNKYNKMLADDKIQPLFTFQQFLDFDREKMIIYGGSALIRTVIIYLMRLQLMALMMSLKHMQDVHFVIQRHRHGRHWLKLNWLNGVRR